METNTEIMILYKSQNGIVTEVNAVRFTESEISFPRDGGSVYTEKLGDVKIYFRTKKEADEANLKYTCDKINEYKKKLSKLEVKRDLIINGKWDEYKSQERMIRLNKTRERIINQNFTPETKIKDVSCRANNIIKYGEFVNKKWDEIKLKDIEGLSKREFLSCRHSGLKTWNDLLHACNKAGIALNP